MITEAQKQRLQQHVEFEQRVVKELFDLASAGNFVFPEIIKDNFTNALEEWNRALSKPAETADSVEIASTTQALGYASQDMYNLSTTAALRALKKEEDADDKESWRHAMYTKLSSLSFAISSVKNEFPEAFRQLKPSTRVRL